MLNISLRKQFNNFLSELIQLQNEKLEKNKN